MRRNAGFAKCRWRPRTPWLRASRRRVGSIPGCREGIGQGLKVAWPAIGREAESAHQPAADIGVDHPHRLPEREAGQRAGRIWTDAGQALE